MIREEDILFSIRRLCLDRGQDWDQDRGQDWDQDQAQAKGQAKGQAKDQDQVRSISISCSPEGSGFLETSRCG